MKDEGNYKEWIKEEIFLDSRGKKWKTNQAEKSHNENQGQEDRLQQGFVLLSGDNRT